MKKRVLNFTQGASPYKEIRRNLIILIYNIYKQKN